MQLRKFGNTRDVAIIGQGTWQIDNDDRASAIAALRRGLDAGMTHIDTAEMYGDAELVVAEAIKGRKRDDLFILSKALPTNASRAGVVAACDRYRYKFLGVEGYHDNCTDNLFSGMAELGLTPPEVPSPLNMWMNIPVAADGSISFQPTVSKAGDFVLLRAEMDVVMAFSSCPQDILPINSQKPVECHFQVI